MSLEAEWKRKYLLQSQMPKRDIHGNPLPHKAEEPLRKSSNGLKKGNAASILYPLAESDAQPSQRKGTSASRKPSVAQSKSRVQASVHPQLAAAPPGIAGARESPNGSYDEPDVQPHIDQHQHERAHFAAPVMHQVGTSCPHFPVADLLTESARCPVGAEGGGLTAKAAHASSSFSRAHKPHLQQQQQQQQQCHEEPGHTRVSRGDFPAAPPATPSGYVGHAAAAAPRKTMQTSGRPAGIFQIKARSWQTKQPAGTADHPSGSSSSSRSLFGTILRRKSGHQVPPFTSEASVPFPTAAAAAAAGKQDCVPAAGTIRDQHPAKPASRHTLGLAAGQQDNAPAAATIRDQHPAKLTSKHTCSTAAGQQDHTALASTIRDQRPAKPTCVRAMVAPSKLLQPRQADQSADASTAPFNTAELRHTSQPECGRAAGPASQPEFLRHVASASQPEFGGAAAPRSQPECGGHAVPASQPEFGRHDAPASQSECCRRAVPPSQAEFGIAAALASQPECGGPGPATPGCVVGSQPFPQLTGITLPLAPDCSPPHTPSTLTLEPVECLPRAPPAPPALRTPLAAEAPLEAPAPLVAASNSSSSYHTCRGPGVSGSGLFASIGPSGGVAGALGVLDLQDTAGTQAIKQGRHTLTEGWHQQGGPLEQGVGHRGNLELQGVNTQRAKEDQQQLQGTDMELAEGDLNGSMLASLGSDSSSSARSQEHPHLASLLPTLEYVEREQDTGVNAALEGHTEAHPHSQLSAPKRYATDVARLACHAGHERRVECGFEKGTSGVNAGLGDGKGGVIGLVDGKGGCVSLADGKSYGVDGKGAGNGLVDGKGASVGLGVGKDAKFGCLVDGKSYGAGLVNGKGASVGLVDGRLEATKEVRVTKDLAVPMQSQGVPEGQSVCPGSAEGERTGSWDVYNGGVGSEETGGNAEALGMPDSLLACCGSEVPATLDWKHTQQQQQQQLLLHQEQGQNCTHGQPQGRVAEADHQRAGGRLLEAQGSKAPKGDMAEHHHHHHHQQQQQQQQHKDGLQRQGLHRAIRTRRRAQSVQQLPHQHYHHHHQQQQQQQWQHQMPQRQKQKQRESEDAACMHTPAPTKLCRRSSVCSPEQAAGANTEGTNAEGANLHCQGSPMAISPAPHVLLPPPAEKQGGRHNPHESPRLPHVSTSSAGEISCLGWQSAACQSGRQGGCLQRHVEQQQRQQQHDQQQQDSPDSASSAEQSPMQGTPVPATTQAGRRRHATSDSADTNGSAELSPMQGMPAPAVTHTGRRRHATSGSSGAIGSAEQSPMQVTPAPAAADADRGPYRGRHSSGEGSPIHPLHFEQDGFVEGKDDCAQGELQPQLVHMQQPEKLHAQPPHQHHHQQQHHHHQQQEQQQQQPLQNATTECGPLHGRPLQPQQQQPQQQKPEQHPQQQQQQQQLQQPLPISVVLGEECCMDYWQPVVGVYETFPFQKDALEFASWCADAPAADLRYMLSVADSVPYRERWKCIMREVGLCKQMASDRQRAWQQQQQQQFELHQQVHMLQQQQPQGHVALPTFQQHPVCGPQGHLPAYNPQHHPQHHPQQASRAWQQQQQQQVMMHAQQQEQQHFMMHAPQQQLVANAAGPCSTMGPFPLHPMFMPVHVRVFSEEYLSKAAAAVAAAAPPLPAAASASSDRQAEHQEIQPEAQPERVAPSVARTELGDPKCAIIARAAEKGPAEQPHREQLALVASSSVLRAGACAKGGSEYTRNFIVTTYPELAKRLARRQPLKRHYYEVLRADQPCHMYLDVEFSQAANPDVKGSQLVCVLIKAVRRLFWDLWRMELPDHCFIELQSQTVDAERPPIPAAAAAAAAVHAGVIGAMSQGETTGHRKCASPPPINQQLHHQQPPGILQQHIAVPEHQLQLQPQQQAPQPQQQQQLCRRPQQQYAPNAVKDLHVLPALPPSCQPDKFSVHLIVRAPGGWAFGGSQHVGQAVNMLRGYAELWEELQVVKEVGSSERTSAVDLAVYSRTRHFRTAWSCKGGKNAVLLPTTRFLGALLLPQAASTTGPASVDPCSGPASTAIKPGATSMADGSSAAFAAAAGSGSASATVAVQDITNSNTSWHQQTAPRTVEPVENTTNSTAPTTSTATTLRPLSCQELLLASMICNVGEGVRVLELPRPTVNPHFMARPGSEHQQLKAAGGKGGGTAVVCDEGALEHPAAPHRSLKVTWLDIPQAFSSAEEAAAMSACRHALQRVAMRMLRFIEAAATERAGGLQAFVGSLTYCGVSGNVTYSLLGPGSHWCGRIQRSHRSNRVYFLANLSIGNWCQKCFDKDCAGFHSSWNPLPEELLESLPAGNSN